MKIIKNLLLSVFFILVFNPVKAEEKSITDSSLTAMVPSSSGSSSSSSSSSTSTTTPPAPVADQGVQIVWN